MKTTQILKAILIGILAGAALFFIPFPFRFFWGFLFIFFAFRFFAWGRWRNRGTWQNNYSSFRFWHNPAYAERWYKMNEDERKSFITKMENELFVNKNASQ